MYTSLGYNICNCTCTSTDSKQSEYSRTSDKGHSVLRTYYYKKKNNSICRTIFLAPNNMFLMFYEAT